MDCLKKKKHEPFSAAKNGSSGYKERPKNQDRGAQITKETKAFQSSAISQPDSRQENTGVALPDDDHVSEARDWVIINRK